MTRILDDIKLDFDDVLIRPKHTHLTSRDLDLNRTFQFYNSPRKWTGFPLIISNMDTTGSFAMHHATKFDLIITCLHKYYNIEELKTKTPDLYVNYGWFSIGMSNEDFEKLNQISAYFSIQPNICIDVANGHTDSFVKHCRMVRESFPDSIILAGNIAIPEMVRALIVEGGVDIVKVGIGPGSVCSTRKVTGIGYPQLSCILECSDTAHGLMKDRGRIGLICADGGCKTSGDVCKAFAANADFVMVGGLVSGTKECEGDWAYLGGQKYHYIAPEAHDTFPEGCPVGTTNNCILHLATHDKTLDGKWKTRGEKHSLKFYGMSSREAQEKHGGFKDYRASEGEVKEVEYKGPVSEVIKDIQGGLRSTLTQVGAVCLKNLAKCTTFIRVNRQK